MAAPPADELRMLRARAYGKDADIHHDPAALRRLDELENGGQTAPDAGGTVEGPVVPAEPVVPTQPVDDLPSDPDADALADDAAAEAHGAEPHSSRSQLAARFSRRKRLGVLWASSLVVVALIAGFGGAAMTEATRIDPFDVGATQVGVLTPDPNAEVPGILGSAEGGTVIFAEFHGMRTASVSSYWANGSAPCLQVVSSADLATATDDSFSGMMYGACGAGAFPAAVQLVVTAELPEELRAAFPEGSALQFVLEDDRVVVFLSESASATTS